MSDNAAQPMGIYKAMIKIMKEMEPIAKARDNQQQHFKFRGVEDFYNTIHDLMAENGVFNLFEIIKDEKIDRQTQSGNFMLQREITYLVKFVHEDGSFVATQAKGEAMDTGDKASNKCMSIAHKYALATTFLAPYSEMDDPDETSPEAKVSEEGRRSAPTVSRGRVSLMTDNQRAKLFELYKEVHPGTDEEAEFGLKALFMAEFKIDAKAANYEQASKLIGQLIAQKKGANP